MDHAAPLPFGLSRALPPEHPHLGKVSLTVIVTLTLAATVAALVVVRMELRVEAGDFLRFVALAMAMVLLSGWCRMRRLDERLPAAAALIAAATLALMLCGIISNVGLGLGAPLADARLVEIDAAFGIDVERAVRAMAHYPTLIGGLAIIYNASGIAVAVLLAGAVIVGAMRKASELAMTCFVSMQLVAVLSVAFPAIGAMAHLQMQDLQGAGLPQGAGVYHLAAFDHFRSGAGGVLRLSDLNGVVTFPSFHTVLALLATQALSATRLRWIAVAWTAAVIVSTIPIGGHYVADLAGGFLVWLAAVMLAQRVTRQ